MSLLDQYIFLIKCNSIYSLHDSEEKARLLYSGLFRTRINEILNTKENPANKTEKVFLFGNDFGNKCSLRIQDN